MTVACSAQWWFWTIVAVVVLGGAAATTALVLTLEPGAPRARWGSCLPMNVRTIIAAAFTASLLTACAVQPAWIVVEVRSELGVPEDIDQLEFEVIGRDTGAAARGRFDIDGAWRIPSTCARSMVRSPRG